MTRDPTPFPAARANWMVAHPLGDAAVRRLNVGWFLDFGAVINGVANLPQGSTLEGDASSVLTRARDLLAIFSDAETPLSLEVSRPTAENLLEAIDLAFESLPSPPDDQIKYLAEARKRAVELQLLLTQELNRQPVYHVFPKRAYDINVLIQDATKLFGDDARKTLSPEAIHDIQEAGKCLAFELPTAAAFHLMRAAETVIREYYALVVGQLPKPKHRNWGAYIKLLRENGANDKIVSALEQIKDLHRNPILHPELQLNLEEAVSLVGIIESVMSTMVSEISRLKPLKASAPNLLSSIPGGAP